ncbi:MAG TPA: hypothetical protein VGG28_19315 [Kofleriaceae bacterium]|jgi:hypothetical protein
MMKRVAIVGVLLGCHDKAQPPPPAPPPPPPVAVADAPPPIDAAAPAPAPTMPLPPLSADVLPPDEATPNTRAVAGDGYHFQIPASFAPTKRGDDLVYTGTLDGAASAAQLTFWATATPFKGTLDALVTRETAAATSAGAKPPDVGPVMIAVGKDIKTGYARRLTIEFPDHFELRTLSVDKGTAYILHCETPNVQAAWANVGTECITRSTTFTIGATPLAAPSPSPTPHVDAPDTPNVTFFGSKIDAAHGWKKATVSPWLENQLVPFMKPCLAKSPVSSEWKVDFDLGADGTGGKLVVVTATGDETPKPGPADVATCLAAALTAHPLAATAKGTTHVVAIFQIRGDF